MDGPPGKMQRPGYCPKVTGLFLFINGVFMNRILIFVLLMMISATGFAQAPQGTNVARLIELARELKERRQLQKAEAIEKAIVMDWPIRQKLEDGGVMELQRLDENGNPVYYITDNLDAARTLSSDDVWAGGSAGLSLDGSGIIIGEWDGGSVLATHQELTGAGRVTQMDSPSGTSDHSTHVAGTMIASGVVAAAHGMATGAHIQAWDYNDDTPEMTSAAAGGLLMSNHSYGVLCGWRYIWWYGDSNVDPNEDYKFGYYTEDESKVWDEIAHNAPYYLIMKSAGNDRGEADWRGSTSPEKDGGADGYDCVGPQAVSKNVLTVGAVDAIPAGYSQASDVVMSSFSGWGPTDDGRIKPDVVANGVGVYSCTDVSNTSYDTFDGTSMATPNTTGSMALVRQHYQSFSSGQPMRAATLKALAIHCADESGTTPGPDYSFGWGLVNTKKMTDVISDEFGGNSTHLIREIVLNNAGSYTIQVNALGTQPLKATICWTDLPGTPVAPLVLNPTDLMLVNDLDLRVNYQSTVYQPWRLNPASPASAATTGDNFRDNVEQVYIASPAAGNHVITVNHKNSLQGGNQAFSLIISGAAWEDNPLPVMLSSFNAVAGNRKVALAWQTESELDNLGFEIARSTQPESGFSVIASYTSEDQLRGHGTSSHSNMYGFDDYSVENGKTYWYKLVDIAMGGQRTEHGPILSRPSAEITMDRETGVIPQQFGLSANFPNPFNPETRFILSVPEVNSAAPFIEINIFDISGKLVKTLYHGNLSAGRYTITWDGTDTQSQPAPSGMYIYSVNSARFRQAGKMMLIK